MNQVIVIQHASVDTVSSEYNAVERHFAAHGIQATPVWMNESRLLFRLPIEAKQVAKIIAASPLSSVVVSEQPAWCDQSLAKSVRNALKPKRSRK